MDTVQTVKRNQLLQTCLNNLAECTELIDEFFSDDEKDLELSTIQQLAKEYHEDETKYDLSKAALKLTQDYFDKENDSHENVEEIFARNVKNSAACIIPFEKHPNMKPIIDALNKVKNKPGTSQNTDDSIVLTQVTNLPVDPITKCEIQNPWKNRICGHTYEYNTIIRYIDSKKSKSKCPYVGCVNDNIKKSDLIEDMLFLKKIKQNQSNTNLSESNIEQIDDDTFN